MNFFNVKSASRAPAGATKPTPLVSGEVNVSRLIHLLIQAQSYAPFFELQTLITEKFP